MGRNKRLRKETETQEKVVNNYKCSECENAFNTENEANNHILKEHYGLVLTLIHFFLIKLCFQLNKLFCIHFRRELTTK